MEPAVAVQRGTGVKATKLHEETSPSSHSKATAGLMLAYLVHKVGVEGRHEDVHSSHACDQGHAPLALPHGDPLLDLGGANSPEQMAS